MGLLEKFVYVSGICLMLSLASCSAQAPSKQEPLKNDGKSSEAQLADIEFVNRITWGANNTELEKLEKIGRKAYLQQQLHPQHNDHLPAPVAAQISDMMISQQSLLQLVKTTEQERKKTDQITDGDAKKIAQKNYQQSLNTLSNETAQRFLWRAIYSSNQLQEQLTWFWMNHFSIYDRKHNLRAMVGDYEDQAIRPHVLGKFRDLLAASVYHPAMLHYLDNDHNAAGHINENYARELMELHTLGVNGGYTQSDVQTLAAILTGLGVEHMDTENPMKNEKSKPISKHKKIDILEKGVVFNEKRHVVGKKIFLGEPLEKYGKAEIDTAIDRLSHHPATAHFISQKLAVYFMGDNPAPALVEKMANTFLTKDGDISAVLFVMFNSPEFNNSLQKSFKDPIHYLVSAARVMLDETQTDKVAPLNNLLTQMGEPLYGRQTPDGYPLDSENWSSSSQLTTRFDIARQLASRMPVDLKNSRCVQLWLQGFSPSSLQALAQAKSLQEWNIFFLSSPEFMHR